MVGEFNYSLLQAYIHLYFELIFNMKEILHRSSLRKRFLLVSLIVIVLLEGLRMLVEKAETLRDNSE